MPQVEEIRITAINTDLSQEKQAVIRQDLTDHLATSNQQDTTKNVVLQFINNQENRPLSNVVVANPRYEVLFTGFDVTRTDGGGSSKSAKNAMVTDDTPSSLQIDPTIRFTAYQNLLKRQKANSFRMKKVIFVGDLNRKIREFHHYGFKVYVELFTGIERTEVGEIIQIIDLAQLPKIKGFPTDGQIDPANINRLGIGDIWFDGVVNLQGENDSFSIQDQTLADSINKVILLETEKEDEIKKVEEEEKLRFVKRKKVVVMLEPTIRRVVASRLKFDEMEQIFDFSNKEQVFKFLEEGLSKGIVDTLETKGLEEVAKLLDNDDRDLFLVGVLGKSLLPQFLVKEAKTFGSMVIDLEETKKAKLFDLMNGKIIERLLKGLQETSLDAFLSRVRAELRESIILELYENEKLSLDGWNALEDTEKNAFLKEYSHEVLASLMLTNTPMFQKKYPEITFEVDQNYESSQFKKLSKVDIPMKISLFAESLKSQKMDHATMDRIFAESESGPMIGKFISLQSKKFFNFFSPEVRKSLWHSAGGQRTAEIIKQLTPRDKSDIILGAGDKTLVALVKDVDYLADLAKEGEFLDLAGLLLLYLKQFNKAESKTGLMTRVASNPDFKIRRMENLTHFFTTDAGKKILDKLSLLIEDLSSSIDSVVCLTDDVKDLMHHESLLDAQFTKIDDIIDTSLVKLLSKGSVDIDKFEKMQGQIEEKIKQTAEKIKESGKHDPVGNYLSDTMIIMLEITTHAMHNKLDKRMLEKLDERKEAKEKILDLVDHNIELLKVELVEAKKKFPAIKKRSTEINEALKKISAQTTEKLKHLQSKLRVFDQYQKQLDIASQHKKKVAITQRNLSKQFSKVIHPTITGQLKTSGSSMSKLFGSFKQISTEVGAAKRVIFDFTDDEIAKLSKQNIVFCTNDNILQRFIVTCLKIDHLNERLFAITGSDAIPADPDLLFLGTDVAGVDFSDIVDPDDTAPFADEEFYQALKQNESQKQKIRLQINKYAKESNTLKGFLEKEGDLLKRMAAATKSRDTEAKKARETTKYMAGIIRKNQGTLKLMESEGESLHEKFSEIDEKFAKAKETIGKALEGGQTLTVETAQKEVKNLSADLSETLLEINKEMAGLMLVKNIRDAGSTISKATQKSMTNKLDAMNKFKGGKDRVDEVTLVSDGSMNGTDIQRGFNDPCANFFGKSVPIREVPLDKVVMEVTEMNKKPTFIILAAEDKQNYLANIKESLKQIKALSPDSHIILITPYATENPHADLVDNLNNIRNLAMVNNSLLVDYTNPSKIAQLFAKVFQ
ncbi:MAG: hypothetical protein QNL04_07750 [SAR324 cluster bacterium]|nr:hypothetical protein [SAR324 cluster bacterium]